VQGDKMSSFSLTLSGGKEIDYALSQMGNEIAKKVVDKELKRSQKIAATEAKIRARFIVGGDMGKRIADAIEVKQGKRKIQGSYMISVKLRKDPAFVSMSKSKFVKVKRGKNKGQMEAVRYYIPAAIEYGHTAPNGTFVLPRSFMRSASDATQKMRVSSFEDGIKKAIDKVVKKHTAVQGIMNEFVSLDIDDKPMEG